ncbi:uncharacterized protein [Aegilops tauschii subsp. strangulata]|uniref:uncharacterized protein n=1 Tax=Aegilops tauschii subsp. strangulata TaxID=200361 RepID=UPI001E1CA8AA|nr:uncharacterized protein LOC109749004 [Aegilops tauschii subsp. strangulata]
MTTQLVEVVDPAAGAVPSAAAGAGFVQRIVTYTVMDDLKVSPMSSISGITLLNKCGVTDIGSLQEKTVQLGYDEGLEILKASLQSKTVLTDVFLPKRSARDEEFPSIHACAGLAFTCCLVFTGASLASSFLSVVS